jgi:redox-sensitive bicupin YhaK (pirin superfamily)
MSIIRRNSLRRGGFAGLRETRLVMSPKIFRGQRESGTSAGIGRFVYLADARFMPLGETRMHSHKEIDVVSIMVEGRIQHEGSLEHGQELEANTVQVQRAGGEGFSHNEINPDDFKNRMIQLWVLPETSDEAAAYQIFESKPGERLRIYGGPSEQSETFAARTIIDVAQVNSGDKLKQAGKSLVYMTTGAGDMDSNSNETQIIREGDLVESNDFHFTAKSDSKLIIVYEQ